MKYLALLFTIIFINISGNIAYNFQKDDTDKQIAQIRERHKQIEAKYQSCKKIEAGWSSGPNSKLEGYYDTETKQFIKIVISIADDWAEGTYTYYLHNSKPFFIFEDEYHGKEFYSAEELGVSDEELWQQGRQAKTLEYRQERIYLANEKCIKYLTKAKVIPSESSSNFTINNIQNQEKATSKINYIDIANEISRMIKALNKEM